MLKGMRVLRPKQCIVIEEQESGIAVHGASSPKFLVNAVAIFLRFLFENLKEEGMPEEIAEILIWDVVQKALIDKELEPKEVVKITPQV